MITPEDFPYIKSLYVNNCYTYRDFNIQLHGYKPFSHLILTGKNGSGKSTILEHLHNYISGWQTIDGRWFQASNNSLLLYIGTLRNERDGKLKTYKRYDETDNDYRQRLINELNKYERVIPSINTVVEVFWEQNKSLIVYSYFKAKRGYQSQKVEGPSKESDFTSKIDSPESTAYFTSSFKQYLVNKKIDQAFAQIDQLTEEVKVTEAFFETLREKLSDIFDIRINSIDFDHKNYEFYLHLEDGRKLTFEVLPEGFSAVLTILMDLFMRVDLIRKQLNEYTYNPCGIVLIDEPEAHLHLQLQEQILPLLTSLFPNIQFIAATHSPAVIASIKNATIFDLTTKETRISEEAVGRSYSDLMMSHFELNNEYSNIADGIIAQVDKAVAEFGNNPARLREVLQPIYDANSAYLSPTLKVKFELLMAEQEAKAVAHS